ncbi:hypothetical protein CAI21_02960 [Alkalilimnicola ehrlichii]|uniref:Uncharacterized protein n=1 Tax=Alkalilimnicola ehrlichii TaxID=351052 RepID=A0A3E0X2T1_9GAMM|nr:hypothetical protein [Alkalilimnicola ehrlichii]RFA30952.1 hypothetical protein CAI21_02960 [Alkalilimnicola ehrlichii]RFA38903.1 hypothetical protein CAL65_03105 [Alkalilimnicola ehrlichii]
MLTKRWLYQNEEGLRIEVINAWKLFPKLRSREALLVNGQAVSTRETGPHDSFKTTTAYTHTAVVRHKEKDYRIKIKLGSKCPGFAVGCHIFVGDELVGGDTASKLMFL